MQGAGTTALDPTRFPGSPSQRTAIAGTNLAVLVVFVVVELAFSWANFPTPRMMVGVAGVALLFRAAELLLARSRKPISPAHARTRAIVSIVWGLLIPFALAAATEQFHTHYFGLLVLPVLEAALYFSLPVTLVVAAIGSCSGILWVAYAAHFRPPYQLGELLETATLVLMLLVVGTVVWFLLNLLRRREAELKERLADLEATRTRLIEGEKLAAIGRLASAMAHEIRNPVAIISSAIEAAGSPAFTLAEREEMSKVAVTESRRLEKLTTDFLTYAQPSLFVCAPVDAAALVGSMISIARAQALGKHVKITLDAQPGCFIFGNEDQLQQALLNLLRNAIDASPESGHVLVELTTQAGQVKVAIRNEGDRIPDEIVARIFEPFFTAKRGGTGLGLSIARKIAETHGGSLELERNAQGCVLFGLLLPSHAVAQTAETAGAVWHAS